jgi:beta-lactamase superfamily II metal-dependent hydrolase
VAGHHGAKTSTSTSLLEATQPEYVFISVGEDNPYRHPAQQTIDRILEFGCKILRTDENGTVIFRR